MSRVRGLHLVCSKIAAAKYVAEGVLPDNQETEDTVMQLLTTGLSGYLKPRRQVSRVRGLHLVCSKIAAACLST